METTSSRRSAFSFLDMRNEDEENDDGEEEDDDDEKEAEEDVVFCFGKCKNCCCCCGSWSEMGKADVEDDEDDGEVDGVGGEGMIPTEKRTMLELKVIRNMMEKLIRILIIL